MTCARVALGLGLLVLAVVACETPEPEFEPPIRLPARDLQESEAGTEPPPGSGDDRNGNVPPDAGTNDGGIVDPCAAPNLVACFTFEDSVNDAKGKLVPSEVSGVAFVAGKSGKAIRLGTGQGSKINFPASDMLSTADTTVETWVKLDPTSSTEATVFGANQRFVMTIEADGTLLCGSAGGAARGNQVVLDKWVHIACVFGAGAVIAYVDGVPGQKNGQFTTITEPLITESAIGHDTPDGTRPLFGTVDTLRVFSVARTQAEISASAKP